MRASDRQNGDLDRSGARVGKYVGRADFEFHNGEMKLVHYQLIPVESEEERVTYD